MKALVLAVVLVALMAGTVGTVSAQDLPEGNPSQVCDILGDLEIPSHGGCVSFVATGEIQNAGYVAQCKMIKAFDPEAFYGDVSLNPETYGFGGTIGSCAEVLRKYHEGEYGH